ncbi:MAG: hypothetical protein HYT12_01110 [Candidatus Liptonbacteria bacterium]|nr:hypothetical protein [Candidatus Liptonbacteria bacterium]
MGESSTCTMEGYGPSPGMVQVLGRYEWIAASPNGLSFPGFVFNDHQLRKNFSPTFNRRYRITFETVPPGKKFSETGYTDYDLMGAIMGKTLKEMQIGGYPFRDMTFKELQEASSGISAYKVVVEKLELTEDDEEEYEIKTMGGVFV